MQIKAFTLITPLIVLALGGFTSPTNVIINPTLPNITDTPIYGPFTKQAGCTTVEFNFTNNSNVNLTNVQETANVYRLVGSTPLYTRTTTAHSVASKSTYSGSILFDTSYFRSYNVLILEFVITNNGNENLYKGSQTVYRATEPSLNAQDYVSTPYTHNQMTFCFSTILTKNCDERITFPSIPTTFGNDLYYKLPIDNFYFTYDAQKTFYYD